MSRVSRRRIALRVGAVLLLLAGCTPADLTAGAAAGAAASSPAAALNLGNRFNLGVGRPGGRTTYKPGQLAGLSIPEFQLTPDGSAVQFRVRMDAATTPNSNYPRSELGEVARWDGTAGTHDMAGISLITHLPARARVVFCQIHDSNSDLVRVQTEGTPTNLRIEARNTPPGGGGERVTVVQPHYTLGGPIVWELQVHAGAGRLLLGGVEVLTFPANSSGLYFKAGAYPQVNTPASEYVSTEILRGSLIVQHTN